MGGTGFEGLISLAEGEDLGFSGVDLFWRRAEGEPLTCVFSRGLAVGTGR